jgi:hypothetical protein
MTPIDLLVNRLAENGILHSSDISEANELYKKIMKDIFIGGYLTRAMKKNKLPYGVKWMNKAAEIEEEAELVYDKSEKTLKIWNK